MKVFCRHGFFYFEETTVGQASVFMAATGFSLVKFRQGYTFEGLENAPNFSLKGFDFMGQVATVNFEGEPWEVFEANGFVYDFVLGLVVPIASVVSQSTIEAASNRLYAKGMIQAGTINQDGKKIKDYDLFYSEQGGVRWLYSGVSYV